MNNIYYKECKNGKGNYLQVKGSGNWTSFPSNSKLSLTVWSVKKKMTFYKRQKGPFLPLSKL